MAIPMPIQQDIRRLDRQGLSRAEIALRLHVDRGTVAKYADIVCSIGSGSSVGRLGDRNWQFFLGHLYEHGYGATKRRLIEWYERAADQGEDRVQKRLMQLLGSVVSFASFPSGDQHHLRHRHQQHH
ncbi:hypothetical protein BW13_10395 [Bifidobacterium sp. UTCIF-37]|uniref:sel1 repeat family protein n=1 Tax=unclassified Bifidobacterium TaxID=2608897 RepID=UPI00112CBE85|nr:MULTISPECIES: sel1 repeat family protein [unclassified Bifidobacterium]TPF85536.1 hypothetical protein BW13_10395 [Bifidobacterium sp. UTCIF-37]TPF87589.1 hypothetical protein BW11_10620 [Bifidobacterium sp. UTCIF-38]